MSGISAKSVLKKMQKPPCKNLGNGSENSILVKNQHLFSKKFYKEKTFLKKNKQKKKFFENKKF